MTSVCGWNWLTNLRVVHGPIVVDAGGCPGHRHRGPGAGRTRRRCRRLGCGAPSPRSRAPRRRSAKPGAGAGPGPPAEPGRGVERDQVHVGAADAGPAGEQPAERLGLLGASLTPGDARVLEGHPPAPRPGDLGGRVEHLGDRVPAVERHELVAQLVVGGVAATPRASPGAPPSARRRIAGHDADGADRDVAGRDAEVVVQPLDRRPHRVVVRERLAHAHEHDVA